MTIIYRLAKGSALTHAELDENFADLDGRVTSAASSASSANIAAVSLGDRLDAVEPIAAGAVQDADLPDRLNALKVVTYQNNPVTGGITNLAGGFVFGAAGVVPATKDLPGIMAAIQGALANSTSRTIQFDDAVYDLGSGYIPIIGGIRYVGSQLRRKYDNGGWTDKKQVIIGGTRFTTTGDRVFWDGAVDLDAPVAAVSGQDATFVAGSASIQVTNGAAYTVKSRVYFTVPAGGFRTGIGYFIVSRSGNILTLGLPNGAALDPVNYPPIAATITETVAGCLAAGAPNDSSSGVLMHSLAAMECDTFIKAGAKNTFSFTFSKLEELHATGRPSQYNTGNAKRLIDVVNFTNSDFRRIWTNDGGGQYWGSNFPYLQFITGNSHFTQIFNANNAVNNMSLKHRGILLQAEPGAYLAGIYTNNVQNNNGLTTEQVDSTVTFDGTNAYMTVADSSKWPVDMPFVMSAMTGATNIYTSVTYFVTQVIDGTKIAFSNWKGNSAITPNAAGTATIRSFGFPCLEVGGRGAGAYVIDVDLPNLDLEGCATAILTMGQCTHTEIGLKWVSGDPAATKFSVCARSSARSIVKSAWSPTTASHTPSTDFDTTCLIEFQGFRGAEPTQQSSAGGGMWYDQINGQWQLSMHHGALIPGGVSMSKVALVGKNTNPTPWIEARMPLCPRINQRDTSATLGGSSPVGSIVFAGAAGQTFTLPTVTDATPATTMVGLIYEIYNAGANALSVSTNGTQLFNGIAGKTTTSIPAGQSGKFVAAKTLSGTLFWAAIVYPALP